MTSAPALQYDVFLSYNSRDRANVQEIARRLKDARVDPWLDDWNLIPGDPWQEAIEAALRNSKSCAVFFGPAGSSPWQNEEMRSAIDQRVKSKNTRFGVIPVFLPGADPEQQRDLPAFASRATWVVFNGTLDDDRAFRKLLAGIRGVEPGQEKVTSTGNPYPGLRSFEVNSPHYYGRDALIKQGLDKLRRLAEANSPLRFLAAVGCSGSGKSSFARAGLITSIQAGAIDGSKEWPVLICRPGAGPLDSLTTALSTLEHIEKSASAFLDLRARLEATGEALHATAMMEFRNAEPGLRMMLFVDQFEECFTLCQKPEWRDAFIRNLMQTSRAQNARVLVLIAMRADFYGECLSYPELADALAQSQIPVPPMQPDELRLAIEQPALANGCEFEPGLVDRLVDDTRGDVGSLPLLQFALQELWNQRKGRYLTHQAYHAMGSVVQALGQRADDLFTTLSESDQKACRRMFLRLVQNVEGSKYTRRRAELRDLVSGGSKPEAVRRLVSQFSSENVRLLTTEGEPAPVGKGVFIEIAHEALIRGWERLSGWLNQDQEFQLWLKRLRFALDLWKEKNKDPGGLLRGALLQEASTKIAGREEDVNEDELQFFQASIDFRAQEEAIAREVLRKDAINARVRRWMAIGLSVVFAAAALGGYFSWRESRVADSRALAADASKIPGKERKLGVWLALYAFAADPSRQATEALYKTVQVAEGAAFQAHCATDDCGGVGMLAFNSGDTKIATAGDDRYARVWDVQDYHSVGDFLSTNPVTSVALSADGQRLAAADGSAIRLYEVGNPKPLFEKPFAAASVFFLPDGRLLSVSADAAIERWSLTGTPTSSRLLQAEGPARRSALSKDGKLILVVNGRTAAVWRLEPAEKIAVLGRPDDEIVAAAFSPDGQQVTTGSENGRVGIWTLSNRQMVRDFQAHGKGISDIAWSDDGKIATGSGDTTARIWSTKGVEQYTLMGSDYAITAVAFSHTGSSLAVGSRDNSVRLYPMAQKDLLARALLLVPCFGPLTPDDCRRFLHRSACPVLPWKIPPRPVARCPE